MSFNENELAFLDTCDEVFEEKKKQNREMRNYIKSIGENLGIDAEYLRRYKDYYHYRGNGWGCREDGTADPLIDVRGVKFKDRISPCFRKLLEVVDTCAVFGDYKLLDPYIKSLHEHGIDIKINIPEKAHKQEYDDYIEFVDGYQSTICELGDNLNFDKKPNAELMNLVSKNNFNAAINAYNKLKRDKDIKDSLDKMSLESTVDQNFVVNAIKYFGCESTK